MKSYARTVFGFSIVVKTKIIGNMNTVELNRQIAFLAIAPNRIKQNMSSELIGKFAYRTSQN